MIVPTPFGCDLFIACNAHGITQSRFVTRARRRAKSDDSLDSDAVLAETRRQLEAYFARRSGGFDVPLVLEGTAFSVAVWRAVALLPAGALASYAEIAAAVGHPNAHRGVARALAATPLALLVPAHRVIGADGRLKGATAGSMRRRLLAFEGIRIR